MSEYALWTRQLLAAKAARRENFEAWCAAVRRLLGWQGGTRDDWADLYAAGYGPREAARRAVYGEGTGD